jgi:hypothetical protein
VQREDRIQLGEIQVHQKEAVAELVSHREKTAVADRAFVDAASHRRIGSVLGVLCGQGIFEQARR